MTELNRRSQVAANRRNNRTKRELPLLAAQDAIPGDMLTSVDAQLERLERQTVANEAYFARLKQFDIECAAEAERLREFCRAYLDRDGFAALESRARYTERLGAVYRLDFWSREASRLEPGLCPHAKDDHAICQALGHDKCPICGSTVRLMADEEPRDQQLTLL